MVQSQTSGDLYVLIFGGSLAFIMLVVGIVVFLLVYQRRIADQEIRVKEMELNHQQELVFRTLDAVEDERKRVARDLHDEVGAALSAMRLLLNQLTQNAPPSDASHRLATQVKGVIDSTIDNVRRISNDLLPQGLDELGLTYALEGLCEHTMSLADTAVELTVDTDLELPTRSKLIVYRLVQELLNNAIKYANATTIRLGLTGTSNNFTLRYTDDGIGFDFDEAYRQRSLGLKNIETRAQMLGGAARFDTQPGAGLRVEVVVGDNTL